MIRENTKSHVNILQGSNPIEAQEEIRMSIVRILHIKDMKVVVK